MCRHFGSPALALLAVASAALLAAQPAAAKSGKAIEVDCGAGATIATALASIGREGGTVLVSGVCHENVVLDRDGVTLQSEPAGTASIIAPDAAKEAVLIRGRNVKVAGFGMITGGLDGIIADRSSKVELAGNTVQGNARLGIGIADASYALIKDNVVSGNAQVGIVVTTSSAADIHRNTVTANGATGISLSRASSADIDGNVITDNGFTWTPGFPPGISVGLASHARLSFPNPEANTISGNAGYGVYCSSFSSVQIVMAQNFGTGNGVKLPDGPSADYNISGFSGGCSLFLPPPPSS
jgi:parallel beta-helix repeat protein